MRRHNPRSPRVHEHPDDRSIRIAGLVARVVSKAVHDSIIETELTGSKRGQGVIADALLAFASTLAKHHFRGTDHLIDASQLARNASALLKGGGV